MFIVRAKVVNNYQKKKNVSENIFVTTLFNSFCGTLVTKSPSASQFFHLSVPSDSAQLDTRKVFASLKVFPSPAPARGREGSKIPT